MVVLLEAKATVFNPFISWFIADCAGVSYGGGVMSQLEIAAPPCSIDVKGHIFGVRRSSDLEHGLELVVDNDELVVISALFWTPKFTNWVIFRDIDWETSVIYQ